MSMPTNDSDALNRNQAMRESPNIANCYRFLRMETIEDVRRNNLRYLVKKMGSVRAVADTLGKSSAQISQWLNASPDSKTGKPRNISTQSAREIERILDKPRGWFDQPISQTEDREPESAIQMPQTKRVPVVGTAQLGDDGYWSELEYPVGHGDGYVDFYSSDNSAYALRCRGDSMAPRIKDGEFVVIEPHAEPRPGDEVMVRAEDGRVMIKELLYVRDGVAHLASVNETHGRIAIPQEQIAAMHPVVGIVKRVRWHPD